MKNLAKKTVAIVAAGIMILFSGCSNLLGGGDSSQNSEKKYTVSGSINLGSALPSSVADAMQSAEASARTATSSFSSASASAVWTVTAKQGEKSVTGSVYQVAGVYKYNLELPLSGEWLLHVKMTIGSSVILEGGASLFAVSGTSQVQDVLVSPVTSSETGSVNLTITDGTANSLIARVSSKAIQNLHAIDSHGGNSVNTGIKEFTNKKAAIVMNNVPAGRYEATLNFEDSAGNILYSCKEIFTVFAGFTTDTWFGESAYIHNGVFTVTDALINGYGTETEPSTKMVLYDAKTEGDNNLYSLSLADNPTSTGIKLYSDTQCNSFAFDKNGYLYALVGNASSFYVTSNRSDFTDSKTSLSYPNSCNVHMAIDRVSDALWLFMEQDHSLYCYKDISTLEKLKTNGDSVVSIADEAYISGNQFFDSNGDTYYPSSLMANNGFVYFASYDYSSKKICLSITDVESELENDGNNIILKCRNTKEFYLADLNLSYNAKVTDMLYQDGAVYLLVRDVSASSSFYSCGAIIRYDVLFESFQLLPGWTNTKYSGKFYFCGSNGILYDSVKGSSDRKPVTYEFSNKYVYAPDSSFEEGAITLSTEAFYGPAKFIAIKPKKLVIADDGFAFYTDANGAFKYNNVNRVVTVDLESFAIDISETSAKFEPDETGLLKDYVANSPTNFYLSIGESATSLYEENANSTAYSADVYAGIPLAGE